MPSRQIEDVYNAGGFDGGPLGRPGRKGTDAVAKDTVFQRPPVLEVKFYMSGGYAGAWNTQMLDPETGKPMTISERALDDAVAAANILKDTRDIRRMRDFREKRRFMISDHFAQCADKLIEQIEAKEGWDKWLEKLEP